MFQVRPHRQSLNHLRYDACLWTYVAKAFNLVDGDRLKKVGPDRLCAEWVLKNSGGVCFTNNPKVYLRDYNALPPENIQFEIKEIDGTDATIMKIGFDHLKGCNFVDTIILNRCRHLEDSGLEGLVHAEHSLRHLEISACWNLTDECLMAIKELRKLESLKVSKMPYIKDIDHVTKELRSALPKCEIQIS